MIDFSVNGDYEQNIFRVAKGDSIVIDTQATINPDFDQLDKLELVAHGNVINSATTSNPDGSITLSHQFKAEESLWLALRTYGQKGTVAHTAPIYVYVDGNENFWNKEASEALALKYIEVLNRLKASTPDLKDEWERFNVENDVLPKWHHAKPGLDADIGRAIEAYQSKIDQARGKARRLD